MAEWKLLGYKSSMSMIVRCNNIERQIKIVREWEKRNLLSTYWKKKKKWVRELYTS
jgi:hypothetical protein